MTPDEKKELTDAVKEGITAVIGDLYIDREQHYTDHQFVKGVRGGVKTERKVGLSALGIAIVGFIIWAIKSWIITQPPTP